MEFRSYLQNQVYSHKEKVVAVVKTKDGLIVSPSKSVKYLRCHDDIDAWQGAVQNTQPHRVCRSPMGSVTLK